MLMHDSFCFYLRTAMTDVGIVGRRGWLVFVWLRLSHVRSLDIH